MNRETLIAELDRLLDAGEHSAIEREHKETLIAELDRLLDAGEPLLTMFPRQRPDHWELQLPDNISEEMRWYADHVSLRAWGGKDYQDVRPEYKTDFLALQVKDFEVGLVRWRAIGVLK